MWYFLYTFSTIFFCVLSSFYWFYCRSWFYVTVSIVIIYIYICMKNEQKWKTSGLQRIILSIELFAKVKRFMECELLDEAKKDEKVLKHFISVGSVRFQIHMMKFENLFIKSKKSISHLSVYLSLALSISLSLSLSLSIYIYIYIYMCVYI